jgi:hypothetical protein
MLPGVGSEDAKTGVEDHGNDIGPVVVKGK